MRPISVVVAADDDLLRRRLRTMLQHLGARVQEVQTVWDAMSLLLVTGAHVDLLISDHHLLPADGLEVLAYARAAGIEVPFLLLTSAGRRSIDIKATRLGATFADKPVVASELLSSVRRICRIGVDDSPSAA